MYFESRFGSEMFVGNWGMNENRRNVTQLIFLFEYLNFSLNAQQNIQDSINSGVTKLFGKSS